MIGQGLRIVLLLFAAVGFGGAGAALAAWRYRRMLDGKADLGMAGVALMLGVFGALCTVVAAGASGVPAFGGVVVWAAYLATAQRLGVFRLEAGGVVPFEKQPAENPQTRRSQ